MRRAHERISSAIELAPTPRGVRRHVLHRCRRKQVLSPETEGAFLQVEESYLNLPLLHGPDCRAYFLFAGAKIAALHVEYAGVAF